MYKKPTTLFCFSPPVMIATFIIEIILLFAVVVRFGLKDTMHRLVAIVLLLLAVFQLAEYFVCGGLSLDARVWSRIGFVSIALLPALGLHLARVIAKRKTVKSKVLVVLAYTNAFGWALLFGLSTYAFRSYECAGNYAIFQLRSPYGGQFFIYYNLWLLVGILASYFWAKQADKTTRRRLYWLIIGYAAFMIPTGITNMVKPETIVGLPSIMCGFAILLAFILVFGVLPGRRLPREIDK
jgi:hypothetical protein